MRKPNVYGGVMLLLGITLLVALLALPAAGPQVVQGAPGLVPTPPAGIVIGRPEPKHLNFWLSEQISADEASDAFLINGEVEKCTISWWLDLELTSGFVNTTTLKLQFSNDNVYWSDGATIDSAQATDTGRSTTGSGEMQQFAVFGRWARVYADVANTNLLTSTVQGVCN